MLKKAYFSQAGRLISGSQNEERINTLTTRYSFASMALYNSQKLKRLFLLSLTWKLINKSHVLVFLVCRIKELGLAAQQYEWYLDLRRHGTMKHSGFNLEFDHMVLFATGLNDVRDVIPFPRSRGKANY